MKNPSATVIDFGSSKISVLCGERAINNSYNIKASADVEYAGFSGGEFFEPNLVFNSVKSAILAAETTLKNKIKKVYVGVPGEFITTVVRETTKTYKRKRKIDKADVSEIFASADIFEDNEVYTLIKKSAIF
ncbi:MAG: hypothetical protein FWG51_04550, partial [Firmicutes bacterium]|nr:hypothetical protein [Bacillota bacterium]